MSDYRSSITVYSDSLTLDEFETLLGPELMEDMGSDDEVGVVEAGAHSNERRWLYWQRDHWSYIQERIEPQLDQLLELRADVTELEWRQEAQDSHYDEVISAIVWTRDGKTNYSMSLLPNGFRGMIAAIRAQRKAGNEHGAWLSVEHLLAGIERGDLI